MTWRRVVSGSGFCWAMLSIRGRGGGDVASGGLGEGVG